MIDERYTKLNEAINRLDGDDKRILREYWFEPAIKECIYSEPEVGVFSSSNLASVFEALIELVK